MTKNNNEIKKEKILSSNISFLIIFSSARLLVE
jgi:hypothetical protein